MNVPAPQPPDLTDPPNLEDAKQPDLAPPPTARKTGWLRLVIQLAVAVALIGGATLGAQHMIDTKPKARKRGGKRGGGPRTAALVETVVAATTRPNATVYAGGTVSPSRQIDLMPEVTGKITSIHPNLIPGGVLRTGELAVKIDDRPYTLAVASARGELTKANANIRLEKGNQEIAQRELAFLGDTIDEAQAGLVLRKPQLDSIKATAQQARTQLQQARLDLDRTRVTVPFDAVVRTVQTNVGSRVTPQTAVATLVGIGTWWVELSVPVDQLKWLRVPSKPGERGSEVRLTHTAAWGEGASRRGHILQLSADLEEDGRMARVWVAVDDPMSLDPAHADAPRLLLGAWVEAAITGEPVGDVIRVERSWLHDGDVVWVMNDAQKLDIRPVTVAFRNRDAVFVSAGLKAGEQVVTSDLPAPAQGMALRTRATSKRAPENRASPPAAPSRAAP